MSASEIITQQAGSQRPNQRQARMRQRSTEVPPADKCSMMLAWQIADRYVLIVGGGQVAAARIRKVHQARGRITLVCPEKSLHPLVKESIELGHVVHVNRVFQPQDVIDQDMVMTAIDDERASREIFKLCRAYKIPVNCADIPDMCDFYFGSEIRQGPLQIMVSTNGQGPRMAHRIKNVIEKALPENCGSAVEKIGVLRMHLKKYCNRSNDDSKKRMIWMMQLCDEWSIEDLENMTPEDMEDLIQGYLSNTVPTAKPRQKSYSNVLGFVKNCSVRKTATIALPGIALTMVLLRYWRLK